MKKKQNVAFMTITPTAAGVSLQVLTIQGKVIRKWSME